MLARAQAGPDDQMLQPLNPLRCFLNIANSQGGGSPMSADRSQQANPFDGMPGSSPDDFSPDLPASPGAALCSQVRYRLVQRP